MRAGFLPSQIVFTGVGKTMGELERAISLSVGVINAESAGELQRIASIAQMQQTTARVALRVNPDIDARSHPHISTGLRTNKFGVPIEDARAMYRNAARVAGLELVVCTFTSDRRSPRSIHSRARPTRCWSSSTS